ncbi:hypothetical protein BGX23_008647 [Mortierella sp. AD031]|nr:hypothetical protein BGX23_008647 [Mortierella sp. AD031]
MKRSSIALFVTAVGASIFLSSTNAAPIIRSSSASSASPIAPPKQHHQQQQQQQQAAVVGRVQIKSKSRHHSPSSGSPSSHKSHKHKHNKKHNKKRSSHPNQKIASSPIDNIPAQPELSHWYNPIRRSTHADAIDRHGLEGHAVLDDEDDDAGNELMDTELDGLDRPDDDDTIEGEILLVEEEETDDGDDDDEGVEGHILQHTLRAANTAANAEAAARARVSAMAANWMKENGIQDQDLLPEDFDDEDVSEEEEVVNVVMSRFGGRVAAADIAAGEV